MAIEPKVLKKCKKSVSENNNITFCLWTPDDQAKIPEGSNFMISTFKVVPQPAQKLPQLTDCEIEFQVEVQDNTPFTSVITLQRDSSNRHK